MMFKKGGFEVSPVVYPVAIKVSIFVVYFMFKKLDSTVQSNFSGSNTFGTMKISSRQG